MVLLYIVAIIFLVGFMVGRASKGPAQQQEISTQERQLVTQQWVDFIAAYYQKADKKTQKLLVVRMLSDLESLGYIVPDVTHEQSSDHLESSPIQHLANTQSPRYVPTTTYTPTRTQTVEDRSASPSVSSEPRDTRDDTVLALLYFGAFLFITSAALFVALSTYDGIVKTVVTLLVAAAFYAGGFIFEAYNNKLRQAAIAFVGIGMAVVPFSGLAYYQYVALESNGPVIWFATSVLCLALYMHALSRLRTVLLGYVLIGSLLSVVLSAMSIIETPVYGLNWGLAFVGLFVYGISQTFSLWPELRAPSEKSAEYIMPVSTLLSFVMLSEEGVLQLGISTALLAMFYALRFLEQPIGAAARTTYAFTTQICANIAVFLLLLGVRDLEHASWGLVLTSLLSLAWLHATTKSMTTRREGCAAFATIGLGVGGILIATESLTAAFFVGILFVASCLALWWRYRLYVYYLIGFSVLTALPALLSTIAPAVFTSVQMIVLVMIATLIVQVLCAVQQGIAKRDEAIVTFAIAAAVAYCAAVFASEWTQLATAWAIGGLVWSLHHYTKKIEWLVLAVIIAAAPIILSFWAEAFVVAWVASLCALVCFITASLIYRHELVRWASVAVWAVVPWLTGLGAVVGDWSLSWYAYAYVAVSGLLLVSRSIARGVLFLRATSSLQSYTKSQSMSYTYGYVFTTGIALFIALVAYVDASSNVLTLAVTSTAVLVITYLAARFVERSPDYLFLVPVMSSIALASWLGWLGQQDGFSIHDGVIQACTAFVGFLFWLYVVQQRGQSVHALHGLYVGSFVPVVAIATFGVLLMAEASIAAVCVSGLGVMALVGEYGRRSRRALELFGGMVLLGIMWLLSVASINELQLYTHLVALLTLLYAYINYRLGDEDAYVNYVVATLAISTVPLVLQALSSAGQLYGIWLLVENVIIMLVGSAIRSSLVFRWGLFVSLGAVMYQLRDLGWLSLSLLAIVIIVIAVRKLLKQESKD